MDLALIMSVVMLAVWTVGTIFLEPPGWFHGLLTVGVFLLIVRVVARGTKKPSGGQGPR
jgi:hypothetical protein